MLNKDRFQISPWEIFRSLQYSSLTNKLQRDGKKKKNSSSGCCERMVHLIHVLALCVFSHVLEKSVDCWNVFNVLHRCLSVLFNSAQGRPEEPGCVWGDEGELHQGAAAFRGQSNKQLGTDVAALLPAHQATGRHAWCKQKSTTTTTTTMGTKLHHYQPWWSVWWDRLQEGSSCPKIKEFRVNQITCNGSHHSNNTNMTERH